MKFRKLIFLCFNFNFFSYLPLNIPTAYANNFRAAHGFLYPFFGAMPEA